MDFFKRILSKGRKVDAPAEQTHSGPQLTIVDKGPAPCARIWAVGGGKGGVGKSLVAANFGIALSRLGKKVLMVDVDFGAANLHTFLNMDGGKATLSRFLKSGSTEIVPFASKTGIENLDLVSGARDSLDVADNGGAGIVRLKEALLDVPYDYVVLDIGPGTSANILDLFLTADEGVLLTTPEPTSIENSYRFLKCLFLRRIRNIASSREETNLKVLLHRIFAGQWSSRLKTVADILAQIKALDPERGELLNEILGDTRVSIIVNQARTQADREIGEGMKAACRSYFGIEIGFLGDIGYEESVHESIRSRNPLILSYGQTDAARGIEACMQRLLGREQGQRRSMA
ncbi:MAG: P-loop NTPase [Thermodesulfobacteriota bacterium]